MKDEKLIFSITRPYGGSQIQYFIWSLASLIFFPIVFLPLFFKYYTLRYRFDAEGLSMRWGLLFRREINRYLAAIPGHRRFGAEFWNAGWAWGAFPFRPHRVVRARDA